ncbi:MAG: hypothetical protein IPK07_32130 [Deltaproteobacteria bacterium]|nr:hypothetical protein [Deltaproteobacteria bacterium]
MPDLDLASARTRSDEPSVALALALVLFLSVLVGARAALPFAGQLFSPAPTWAVEHAVAADMLEVTARIRATTGRAWGYDPHVMAGYPFTALEHNFASFQLAALAWPSLGGAAWLRLGTVLAWASIPALVFGSLLGFGLGRRAALAGAVAGALLLATSELELFRATGAIVGGYVSVLLLPALAGAHAYLARGRTTGALACAGFAALALLVHKGAALLVPVPVLVWVLAYGRGQPRRVLALLALGVACTAALNVGWILPALRYRHWLSAVPWPLWLQHDPLRLAREALTPVAGFDGFDASAVLGESLWGSWLARNVVLGFGLIGLARLGDRRLAMALAAALAWLAAIAFFGSWLAPIAAFEPFRYVIAYRLLWVVPAAVGLIETRDAWFARGARPRWLPPVAAAVTAFACLLLPTYAAFVARQPMSASPPPSFGALVDFARDPVSGEGRLMVEDAFLGAEDPGPYGGAYVLGQLALATGRELIGGRSPWIRMLHRFASFTDGEAFGTRLAELTRGELLGYLERYDVTAVAAWSAESKRVFDALAPEVTRVGERGPLSLYRVARVASRFERGRGHVASTWGELALSDVEADGGEVVLRYHWAEGLTATPAARRADRARRRPRALHPGARSAALVPAAALDASSRFVATGLGVPSASAATKRRPPARSAQGRSKSWWPIWARACVPEERRPEGSLRARFGETASRPSAAGPTGVGPSEGCAEPIRRSFGGTAPWASPNGGPRDAGLASSGRRARGDRAVGGRRGSARLLVRPAAGSRAPSRRGRARPARR